jgi:hypothetical protein
VDLEVWVVRDGAWCGCGGPHRLSDLHTDPSSHACTPKLDCFPYARQQNAR